ncbi:MULTISPECIES: response regulator transcription factor [unclassified Paenibacillus]|uniref:response regulator transcription factor n=1 Tax=unclassified Paenibacillus TaxID=185978 RepID=UPI000953AC4E|nr:MULTISPECIES: response regulator transcription factor [unclassified Paenibacillus]ASS67971.1 response regulator transcription factor [Paenibacillus sp. RUD330]SIR42522.1 DNA-binding response regulator, OmpR family, contains REC and winged-helix (wHTH) domain [Paenibacillus sp. RU4X]SIR52602.1 DNA-binding response regulator, OmpR family, contains REC and winged-helix (wHTH) domain [Paenibacillus sp. RU4T]
MRIHILVADDDSHIRELLRLVLTREGYAVSEAADGRQAVSVLEAEQVHLAVVDVMMPLKDGLELTEEIRRQYDLPVILLTAKGTMADKEKGFEAGTDDYLVKPFEPQELLFRIRALLRRYRMASSEVIRLGGVTIDRASYEVDAAGQSIVLPLREFQLLAQLASQPGRIHTREQLISMIWGTDYEGDSRTVDVHVKRLRERFEPYRDDFVITTIRGLGYKLETGGGLS